MLHNARCTLYNTQFTLHNLAYREDFVSSLAGSPEVDCVITSLEIEEMLGREETRLEDCTPSPLDSVVGQVLDFTCLLCFLFSASASQ